jgi:hypothetical protein
MILDTEVKRLVELLQLTGPTAPRNKTESLFRYGRIMRKSLHDNASEMASDPVRLSVLRQAVVALNRDLKILRYLMNNDIVEFRSTGEEILTFVRLLNLRFGGALLQLPRAR